MKRTIASSVLLVGALAFAQQVPLPPGSTPPTFPQDRQTHPSPRSDVPDTRMPPDIQAPENAPEANPRAQQPDETRTSAALEKELQSQLNSDPSIAGNVIVSVSTDSISVAGTVDSRDQHDRVLQLVQANAGNRKIVDRIKIRS